MSARVQQLNQSTNPSPTFSDVKSPQCQKTINAIHVKYKKKRWKREVNGAVH